MHICLQESLHFSLFTDMEKWKIKFDQVCMWEFKILSWKSPEASRVFRQNITVCLPCAYVLPSTWAIGHDSREDTGLDAPLVWFNLSTVIFLRKWYFTYSTSLSQYHGVSMTVTSSGYNLTEQAGHETPRKIISHNSTGAKDLLEQLLPLWAFSKMSDTCFLFHHFTLFLYKC